MKQHIAIMWVLLSSAACKRFTGGLPDASASPASGDTRVDLGSNAASGDTSTSADAEPNVYAVDTGPYASALCPVAQISPLGCVDAETCDGLDNNCNGAVDEGCPCDAGAVQRCFLGPPGRHNVGACTDGEQQCVGAEFGSWGQCTGGVRPQNEFCDGLDNDCNGCADEIIGCRPQGSCPGPGDARTPTGAPFSPYVLNGRLFYAGPAASWMWEVQGGPCDQLGLQQNTFTLTDRAAALATFTPKLSGDYSVRLRVTESNGSVFECTWIVRIVGPGLRIEMCYPESESQDLDLFLHSPLNRHDWYRGHSPQTGMVPDAACGWHNCEPRVRQAPQRIDWNYAPSRLAGCIGGPLGAQWQALGHCPNPRLDVDNNLVEGRGLPENINVDAPRDNETFRIMVHNFTGRLARPVVSVYCDGNRRATFGMHPEPVTGFGGDRRSIGEIGPMWRVADVTTHVVGGVTTCDVAALHPTAGAGYLVTTADIRY